MKILVLNYSFDASAKTVTFTDYNPLVLERVLLITNVTDNEIIYNFSDPDLGGTAATNVLTLTYDTTGMSDTDDLQIFYEDGDDSMAINDGGNTITVDGTVAVTNSDITSIKTAVEIMDDWDDSNYCNVNANIAGTDITAGAGSVGASTPRVTLASDDPAVSKLTTIDADTGTIAGDTTSIDGKITACNTGAVVISSGTVSTITNVVHVDDNSGNLSIDDGGNVITVDGTVNIAVGGQAPQLDDTDKIAMSMYGKGTVAGDTAVDVDTDGHLQVDVLSGGGAGEQYADGTVINAAYKGNIVLGDDGSNYQILKTDADGHVQVDVLSGGGGGTQYTEGDTDATITGTAILWEDAADTLVTVNASNPLPVSAPSTGFEVIQGTAADLNCTEASASAIKTAVEIMDDWDDSNYCNVNANIAGTDITAGAGAVAASTPRVTLASDDPAVTSLQLLDNAISGAGFNITQFAGAAVPIGAGTEAAALRVTVATDSTGVLSIDDNGGAITVDGTVAVSGTPTVDITKIAGESIQVAGGTEAKSIRVTIASDSTGLLSVDDNGASLTVDNADITSCKTALELLDNSVDGNYLNVNLNIAGTDVTGGAGAVGATTQRVTLASDDPAVTSLAILDDWDSGDTCKVTAQAGTAAIGKLLPPDIDITTHSNYARKYYTNAGAVTDGIIWSPAAGKRWHVTSLYIQTSAAATVTLEDDKSGGDDPVWKSELAANSGVFMTFPDMYPFASGEDVADLTVTTSAGNIYIAAVGYEV